MLLNELEEYVTSATRVPAMRRGLMDQQKLLELVDRIRVAIPQSVREADQILEKRESIVNQALVESRKVRSAAEEEARQRVDDSEIMQTAEQKAQEIVDKATQRAQDLVDRVTAEARQRRQEADRYAYEKLEQLEKDLSSFLATVRKGIEVLSPAQQRAEDHR